MNGESYEDAIGAPQGEEQPQAQEETAPGEEAQVEEAPAPQPVASDRSFPTSAVPPVNPGGYPYPVEEPSFKTVGIAGRQRARG